MGILDPVNQVVLNGHALESKVGPLVPVERDASSCSSYPHDCEAVSRWEADRQYFCGSSGELGIDERTGVEFVWNSEINSISPLSPTLPCVRREEKILQLAPSCLLNGQVTGDVAANDGVGR